jgi:formylmethanofuran dehydrogenase subunit E
MKVSCHKCGNEVEISEERLYSTGTILCDDCQEQIARENYEEEVRWQENMNIQYYWDEGGFCNGFTQY